MYDAYGNYIGEQPVGGSIGISGQFLGVPMIYWLIGAALFFAFRKKL